MKTATRKIRSAVKWHGGKTYLCRRFINLFPEHDVYVEPFLGGGSVLLNKPRSRVEIASDLDADLIRMWRTLQSRGDEVRENLLCLSYSPQTFEDSLSPVLHLESEWDVTFTTWFIVRNRMSRGGLGEDFAWSDRLRGGQPGDVNAWQTFVQDDLPRVIERIQGVEFRCQDAIDLIDQVVADAEKDDKGRADNVLFYCDPPYLHETRTTKDAYSYEMSPQQHMWLLDALDGADMIGCDVFVSGYPSMLYYNALEKRLGWTLHEFRMKNHSGQGKVKQGRTECLWESPS